MAISIDLSGRTVLITGASSGLGAHFAKLVVRAGGAVALCARRKDKLDSLCGELTNSGGNAKAIEMDVTDEESIIAAYDEAITHFGAIDSVLANAGMNNEGMAFDIDKSAFDGVINTNLTGAFLSVREGAKRMIASDAKTRGHGRIVIISSITAYAPSPGLAAYSASKAGALQMGKSLAREWANTGVNVNIVCPGYIETDLNRDWFATEGGRKQIRKWPRRRLMQETDLDHIVALLLSDASRGITGASFTIDDGQTL